ncbi:hypothetical protein [Holdemania massiliensis]|uniref:hypothetical protein n=1 Tax=Holdemania massiliensis TaxID=1468449 RepID=UPI001F0574BF|nr:hypothetical protein [Holdemania massiliensis]MCH1941876.1 hypothetical protein [Holdemania massiliensis]
MKAWEIERAAHRLDKSIKNNDRKEEFYEIVPFLLTDLIAVPAALMTCRILEKRR